MKRKQFKSYLLLALSAIFVVSCTDLEIEPSDSIIDQDTASGGIFNGVENVEESGTDWGDNGIWRTLHNHTWTPSHAFVLNTWNNWNQSIFLASEIADSRSNPSPVQAAEAKFARAFARWIVLDNWGQVPDRPVDAGPQENPAVLSSVEAYNAIIADLDDAIADLPTVAAGAGNELQRPTKATARFLKARVLLNAQVYDGSGSADAGNMAEVISLVDAIAADGYALESGYFDIFKADADSETIWWVPTGVGNRIWNGMHYNQNSPDNGGGGWNGFSTLAEFYDLFEGPESNAAGSGQEERRGFVPGASDSDDTNLGIGFGFLIGQQYNEDGTPLNTRPGPPLVFTKEFPGLVGNGEASGVRIIKYHPVNGGFTSHEIIFRYADAHLMKAEAMMRSGGDPTAMVNELRVLRQASPLGSVGEAELLAERGRELYVEAVRRTDLIRFGQFTKDWEFKDPAAVGDANRNLYPIPSNAILSNPNLVQNPGY